MCAKSLQQPIYLHLLFLNLDIRSFDTSNILPNRKCQVFWCVDFTDFGIKKGKDCATIFISFSFYREAFDQWNIFQNLFFEVISQTSSKAKILNSKNKIRNAEIWQHHSLALSGFKHVGDFLSN